MKLKFLIPFIVIVMISCNLESKKAIKRLGPTEKTISIFRSPYPYEHLSFTIDNKFTYIDTSKSYNEDYPCYYLTKYITSNKQLNIHLKVNNRDTSLTYDISKCDSLLFSFLPVEKHFRVFNNHNYVWHYDD